jgi:hypothetical protein
MPLLFTIDPILHPKIYFREDHFKGAGQGQ